MHRVGHRDEPNGGGFPGCLRGAATAGIELGQDLGDFTGKRGGVTVDSRAVAQAYRTAIAVVFGSVVWVVSPPLANAAECLRSSEPSRVGFAARSASSAASLLTAPAGRSEELATPARGGSRRVEDR